MKVKVKLFASLRRPGFERGQVEVTDGAKVREVLQDLGVPLDHVAVVLVNGRHTTLEHQLADGEDIAVFPAISGG